MDPLRIALIGAPGSGKTDLAKALFKIFHDRGDSVVIVDDYVQSFQDKTQIATGIYGTYIVNMQLAMWRFQQEQQALALTGKPGIITCGTLIETSIYQAINAFKLADSYGEGNISQRILADQRTQTVMSLWGIMRIDTWNYDHALYLPLGDFRDENNNAIATLVDDHIIEAAETFNVELTKLPDNDVDKQLEVVLDLLKETIDEAPVSHG